MKQLLLLTCVVLSLFTTALAQKKTWLLAADGYIDHQEYEFGSLNNWKATLVAGKQVSNKFTVGIHLAYSELQYLKTVSLTYNTPRGPIAGLQNQVRTNPRIELGAWCRLTKQINERFFVYGHLTAATFSTTNGRKGYTPYTTPLTSVAIMPGYNSIYGGYFASIYPGIGMNIWRHWGVYANIGGLTYTTTTPDTDMFFKSYRRLTFNLGQQLTVGVQKILGWKKAAKISVPAK